MVNVPTFSCFWVKSAVVGRILEAVIAAEGTDELEMVQDDVCEEKTAVFDEISLTGKIFVVFRFSASSGSCDMLTSVAGVA